MNCLPLSRAALARVLQSLLAAEIWAARGSVKGADELAGLPSGTWPESLKIAGHAMDSLGCDSLELLALAAATNQMFHLAEADLDSELFAAYTFGDWLDVIQMGWRVGIDRITLRTSGSTGVPKNCSHKFSHLQTEVQYLAEIFAGKQRIVAMARAHHIYGFIFNAMLPDKLGVAVISDGRWSSPGILQPLREGDLVVAVPDRWQFLDRTLTSWPRQIDGVVSTAPCSRELIRSLMQRGLHGMTEIYGSTETSGIGTRAWPERSYRLMPHWHPDASGQAEVKGLVHDSGLLVHLMDQVKLFEDGGFELAGRLDGSVQVAGTNVYPTRIAALLVSLPGVVAAKVSLMRPEEGIRLKAFIVPRTLLSPEALRTQLDNWVVTHLSVAERPRRFTFGAALPVDIHGKAMDW